MGRLTSQEVGGLMEAYNSIYAPQVEITEEQIWEEVKNWVDSLVAEGYDLSDYTWEDMYESYLSEGGPGPRAKVVEKQGPPVPLRLQRKGPIVPPRFQTQTAADALEYSPRAVIQQRQQVTPRQQVTSRLRPTVVARPATRSVAPPLPPSTQKDIGAPPPPTETSATRPAKPESDIAKMIKASQERQAADATRIKPTSSTTSITGMRTRSQVIGS